MEELWRHRYHARIILVADADQLAPRDHMAAEGIRPGPADTYAELLDIRSVTEAELMGTDDPTPNERFRERVQTLLRHLVALGASDRSRPMRFDRDDFTSSLAFSTTYDFVGSRTAELLSRAWRHYYGTPGEEGAAEGISAQIGEVLTPDAFRDAAAMATKENMPNTYLHCRIKPWRVALRLFTSATFDK